MIQHLVSCVLLQPEESNLLLHMHNQIMMKASCKCVDVGWYNVSISQGVQVLVCILEQQATSSNIHKQETQAGLQTHLSMRKLQY